MTAPSSPPGIEKAILSLMAPYANNERPATRSATRPATERFSRFSVFWIAVSMRGEFCQSDPCRARLPKAGSSQDRLPIVAFPHQDFLTEKPALLRGANEAYEQANPAPLNRRLQTSRGAPLRTAKTLDFLATACWARIKMLLVRTSKSGGRAVR